MVMPSNAISSRSAAGSSSRCALGHRGDRLVGCGTVAGLVEHPDELGEVIAERGADPGPAGCARRPRSSASRARPACMSPFAHHASSQSAQFSSLLVTRVKSPGSTPCDVNRGPQLAMADLTCSSGTGILSLRSRRSYAIICSAICASAWPRSSPCPVRAVPRPPAPNHAVALLGGAPPIRATAHPKATGSLQDEVSVLRPSFYLPGMQRGRC